MSLGASDETGSVRPVERRGEPRLKVFLGGKVAFVEGGFSTDCLVRNLSRSGAAVELADEGAVSRGPLLVITKQARAHITESAWVSGRRAGLKFTRTWDLSQPGDAPAWVRALWLEIAPR